MSATGAAIVESIGALVADVVPDASPPDLSSPKFIRRRWGSEIWLR